MTIKNAVAVSILIHSMAAAPFYNARLIKQRHESQKPIVIDYVVIKEPIKVEKAKAEELKSHETPKVEVKKAIDIRPSDNTSRDEAVREEKMAKVDITKASKRQVQLKSTPDYINYYQLIRERVRHRLKRNYKARDKTGDVHLVFTLSADGSLAAIDIYRATSTDDGDLINVATSSMREAAPFPAFPKTLTVPKMSFTLIVSFKRE